MNEVFEKLKSEITQAVQPLVESRETARQRCLDLRRQVQDFRNQAAETQAELKGLDAQLTQALIDEPDKSAGIQKKIQKTLQSAKDLIDSGDRLEKQLPAVDAELKHRENAVSIAVSRMVIDASKEHSEAACQQFLDLFWTFHKWLQAVTQLRQEMKVSGLDGLHSHRLNVKKAVQSLPPDIRIFWHRFVKVIAGDFGSFGSHAGDI